MKWEEIKACYPQQWLLIEALNAHSDLGMRVVDELSVIETFKDSPTALRSYSKLHREAPNRELYVFHTSRDRLDIEERQWLGMRIAG